MPAKSKAQRRLMGADYQRAKAGKETKTGMTKSQLKEMASGSEDMLPYKKKKKKGT